MSAPISVVGKSRHHSHEPRNNKHSRTRGERAEEVCCEDLDLSAPWQLVQTQRLGQDELPVFLFVYLLSFCRTLEFSLQEKRYFWEVQTSCQAVKGWWVRVSDLSKLFATWKDGYSLMTLFPLISENDFLFHILFLFCSCSIHVQYHLYFYFIRLLCNRQLDYRLFKHGPVIIMIFLFSMYIFVQHVSCINCVTIKESES